MNKVKFKIQSQNNIFLSVYDELMTKTEYKQLQNYYYLYNENDNKNNIDNMHQVNISLDKNDNSFMNNCKLSNPNVYKNNSPIIYIKLKTKSFN